MPVSKLMGAEATSEMHGKCLVALGVGNDGAGRGFYVVTEAVRKGRFSLRFVQVVCLRLVHFEAVFLLLG
jgi:hypothetical protein